jgi:hypothetical protein
VYPVPATDGMFGAADYCPDGEQIVAGGPTVPADLR